MYDRLYGFLYANMVFYMLMGFRKTSQCVWQLFVSEKLVSAIEKAGIAVGLFMDFSKANLWYCGS